MNAGFRSRQEIGREDRKRECLRLRPQVGCRILVLRRVRGAANCNPRLPVTGTLLRVGLRHSQTLTVDAGMTVPNVSPAFGSFRDMPEVFATAYMVGFIESTCIEALHPYLAADQRTVGIHINVSHSAATPVGMSVTAEVELIAVEGRRLQFRVECRDAKEIIAAGTHDRAIVDLKKFATRLQAKAEEPGIARAMREKAS